MCSYEIKMCHRLSTTCMTDSNLRFPIWQAGHGGQLSILNSVRHLRKHLQCTMQKKNGSPIFHVQKQYVRRRNNPFGDSVAAEPIGQTDIPLIQATLQVYQRLHPRCASQAFYRVNLCHDSGRNTSWLRVRREYYWQECGIYTHTGRQTPESNSLLAQVPGRKPFARDHK